LADQKPGIFAHCDTVNAFVGMVLSTCVAVLGEVNGAAACSCWCGCDSLVWRGSQHLFDSVFGYVLIIAGVIAAISLVAGLVLIGHNKESDK
jgi:hypothetical protein